MSCTAFVSWGEVPFAALLHRERAVMEAPHRSTLPCCRPRAPGGNVLSYERDSNGSRKGMLCSRPEPVEMMEIGSSSRCESSSI